MSFNLIRGGRSRIVRWAGTAPGPLAVLYIDGSLPLVGKLDFLRSGDSWCPDEVLVAVGCVPKAAVLRGDFKCSGLCLGFIVSW